MSVTGYDLLIYTAYFVVVVVGIGAAVVPNLPAIRYRWAARRVERQIRRRTLHARKELTKKLAAMRTVTR